MIQKNPIKKTIPQKTTYQQINQTSNPISKNTQKQPTSEFIFNQINFTNPSFHNPTSFFNKISNPTTLNLDPNYNFFLKKTQTKDHNNNKINNLNNLNNNNNKINNLIKHFDKYYKTNPFNHNNNNILNKFN